MVAVNILPAYTLEEWRAFWKRTGAGDVLWAQDAESQASKAYQLLYLGTEVVVDRQGRVAFRSDGPARYEALRAALEKTL